MLSWRPRFLPAHPLPARRAPVTRTILWSIGGVFALQLLYAFYLNNPWTMRQWTFSPEAWQQGRWWTLMTYGWIHSETIILHILANALLINFLGPVLEEALGWWRYLTLYLIGGVLAAALTWWALDSQPGDEIAGASGAVFALLAAAAVLWPRWRLRVLLFFIIPINCTVRTLFWVLCAIEAFCWLTGTLAWIGHSAHLGGALGGALLAWSWKPKKSEFELVV